jgi:uncharacterized protein YwqG
MMIKNAIYDIFVLLFFAYRSDEQEGFEQVYSAKQKEFEQIYVKIKELKNMDSEIFTEQFSDDDAVIRNEINIAWDRLNQKLDWGDAFEDIISQSFLELSNLKHNEKKAIVNAVVSIIKIVLGGVR